jgi:hypothetical protein
VRGPARLALPESWETAFNLVTMVPGEGLEPSRPEGPAGLSLDRGVQRVDLKPCHAL